MLTAGEADGTVQELRRELNELRAVLRCPNTIWSVLQVLGKTLDKPDRKLAGKLAYLLHRHEHDGRAPVSYSYGEGLAAVSHYAFADLWMVKAAIRWVENRDEPAPAEMDPEHWSKCCAQALQV